VLKGLVRNSFLETRKFFTELVVETQGGFIIDPKLFKKYNITRSPSFVLARGTDFDVVGGTVTAQGALELFALNGDLNKEAQLYLIKYRGKK
jgi:type-F conjugative transfer system pilin assembly protein TrbC